MLLSAGFDTHSPHASAFKKIFFCFGGPNFNKVYWSGHSNTANFYRKKNLLKNVLLPGVRDQSIRQDLQEPCSYTHTSLCTNQLREKSLPIL